MIVKNLITSAGKHISVYDDVFTRDRVLQLAMHCQCSAYTLENASYGFLSSGAERIVAANYKPEEVENIGFFHEQNILDILAHHNLSLDKKLRTWILMSTHMSKYSYHADCYGTGTTVLYYANPEWDYNWNGETIFCADDGEAEIAIGYKPNRVVVFDSSILHKPSSVSYSAPPYRFTITSTFSL